MKWMNGRPSRGTLLALSLLALLCLGLTAKTRRPAKQRWFDEKLRAAQTASLADFAIRDHVIAMGIAMDSRNDPNQTGLIGDQFTAITTDRGLLKAKLTVTNPNFAGAVVDMLKRARVRHGDQVAIGLTGSMPGLNIAALAACEALGLKPVVITSVGSSMWGANRPELTWLDMEKILVDKGILHTRSVAASLGGGSDNGRGLSPEGRKLLRAAIDRNGVEFLDLSDLESNIRRRMEIYAHYEKKRPIAVYINVGGGLASLGGAQNAQLIPPGLSTELRERNYPVRGVINRFAERGIPVIQLASVDELAKRYDLPEAPVPLPPIGEGALFFRDHYAVVLVAGYLALLAAATFVLIRIDVRYYLAGRRTPLRRYRPPASVRSSGARP